MPAPGRTRSSRGWHQCANENLIWSKPEATATLRFPKGACSLHLHGVLPPAPHGQINHLHIVCNGIFLGSMVNASDEMHWFDEHIAVPAKCGDILKLQFEATHHHRPSADSSGEDTRTLGFGLVHLATVARTVSGTRRARSIVRQARWLDRLARLVTGPLDARRSCPPLEWGRGISIVIPERASPTMLAECLESVQRATAAIDDPIEVIVVVNGSSEYDYELLARQYPDLCWIHIDEPLGFVKAIRRGLAVARYPGVYLLNNDMVVEPDALAKLLPWRAGHVFAVGSQILFQDKSR